MIITSINVSHFNCVSTAYLLTIMYQLNVKIVFHAYCQNCNSHMCLVLNKNN